MWRGTEVWVRRVSGLLLPVPGNCEGRVGIRFDEQPFHSLPAQRSANMTVCFGHKLQHTTEYSVSNFVLTQVLKHLISTLLHTIRYNFLLLMNLKKGYLPQAKMWGGKLLPYGFAISQNKALLPPCPCQQTATHLFSSFFKNAFFGTET